MKKKIFSKISGSSYSYLNLLDMLFLSSKQALFISLKCKTPQDRQIMNPIFAAVKLLSANMLMEG